MKSLKLTNLEKMNQDEMMNVNGGRIHIHLWIGITFRPGGPCSCAVNCGSAGLRHDAGHTGMHSSRID